MNHETTGLTATDALMAGARPDRGRLVALIVASAAYGSIISDQSRQIKAKN